MNVSHSALLLLVAAALGAAACGAPLEPTPSEEQALSPSAPDAASADCARPLIPGSDRRCTIRVGGQDREVLLYAPRSYDPGRPAALVVDAHGAGETAAAHAGLEPFHDWPRGLGSGWRLVADREGFLVAQPQGLGNVWREADAELMLAIPSWVARHAAVDPDRTFLTGISNGGALTYWTACRDRSVYQAFAPLSGFGLGGCSPARPASLLHFHSPEDRIIPLASGEASFRQWVQSQRCARGPIPAETYGGVSGITGNMCLSRSGTGASTAWSLTPCATSAPTTTCERWEECEGGSAAVFCRVAPDRENHFATTGGHIVYLNATSLSIAAATWRFFVEMSSH